MQYQKGFQQLNQTSFQIIAQKWFDMVASETYTNLTGDYIQL